MLDLKSAGHGTGALIYPDTTAVTYAFDNADRMQSLSDWVSRVTSYADDPDNRLRQVTNFRVANLGVVSK